MGFSHIKKEMPNSPKTKLRSKRHNSITLVKITICVRVYSVKCMFEIIESTTGQRDIEQISC